MFVLSSVIAAGCAGSMQHLSPAAVPISGRADVHVAADDANVHVATADIGQVEMQVIASGYDPGDLDVSMTPHGSRIDIIAKTRPRIEIFSVTRHRLDLEIRVPRDADVDVHTDDGSVTAEAIAGTLAIETADGRVDVRQARGAIRLHTDDGSITARGVDGFITASSGDGSIELEGRFDGLDTHTSSGRVTANASAGSRMVQAWRVDTGDGSVRLGLPRDLAAHVDLKTDDGHIDSELPLPPHGSSNARGDLNGGGPPITIRTGDGSIRLVQI